MKILSDSILGQFMDNIIAVVFRETRQERVKSAVHISLKKCSFLVQLRAFFIEMQKKVPEHPKGTFRARRTFQKFGNSVPHGSVF